MGLWATWSSWRCPCSLHGAWARWPLKVTSNQSILWFYEFPASMRIRKMKERPFLIALPVYSMKQKSIRSDGNCLAFATPASCRATGCKQSWEPKTPSPSRWGGTSLYTSAKCLGWCPSTCWSCVVLPHVTCYWGFPLGCSEPAELSVGWWLTDLAQCLAISIFNLMPNGRKKWTISAQLFV